MKKTLLLLTFLSSLSAVSPAYSNDFYNNPETQIIQDGGTYGLLGAPSEIDADRVLSYSCPAHATPAGANELNGLRAAVGEYLYLQAYAIHPESIAQLSSPSGCGFKDA